MPSRATPIGLPASLCGLVLALAVSLTPLVASGLPQRGKTPPSTEVPPVSMTCPMHPDVVETTPGTCPICKMNLVPVRLETVWTCPVHSVVSASGPGACPICRRDLIQMTVALTWTCADRPDVNELNRGTCPDGKPMLAKRTLRPHGNHNPQHGGQFFMAPDNFHHLEGAYPRPRVFRLYLYDDYARPLPADQIKRVKGRVVTTETFDAAKRTTTEVAAFPLVAARTGPYLEARIGEALLPAQMTAKVRFKSDAAEYRFDFTFAGLSKDSAPPASATSRVARADAPAASASAATAAPPPSQTQATTPWTLEEMLAQLKNRNAEIGELVRRGDFGAVWVPAFQAKDLAIALEPHVSELSPARREEAEPAIARLVRTAWLLDAFGDIGNRQQIEDAYSIFQSTVADVGVIFQK